MKQRNDKRFKKIKQTLITLLIISVLTMVGTYVYGYNAKRIMKTNNIEYVSPNNDVMKKDSHKQHIQNELVTEVSKYVNTVAPRAHQFIPKYIVQAGLANDIDICFMLAQTQIETAFGTAGAGRSSSRHSLFGVAVKRYSNYEHAINDYCSILKRSYLVKGRTEQHLMAKYVTGSGARYASARNYEHKLSNAYKNIKKQTNIYSLQQEYMKL